MRFRIRKGSIEAVSNNQSTVQSSFQKDNNKTEYPQKIEDLSKPQIRTRFIFQKPKINVTTSLRESPKNVTFIPINYFLECKATDRTKQQKIQRKAESTS